MSEQSSSNGMCDHEPMTRAQLLVLRNSGQLEAGCSYIITDYSRGCLGAALITLTATSTGELSMDVSVDTTFDNVSWEGRYDIDTNRIVQLQDNLGNRVGGRYGNEVDRFAWGLTNVTDNEVWNSDVYMDCATPMVIRHNRWSSRSYTDLRGAEGSFVENTIDSYGRIYMNGTTLVNFNKNNVSSYSYLYFNGQSDLLIYANSFTSNSYVRKYGGDRWTMFNSSITRGDIRMYAEAGTFYVNGLTMLSSARIYNREQGELDIRYTTVGGYSYFDLRKISGRHRIWYGAFENFAYYYTRVGVTAGNINNYYSSFQSGTFDYFSGTSNMNIYYHKQQSNGYVRLEDQTGNLNLYQNTVQSRGGLRLTAVSATLNMYYNTIQSYSSRVNITNLTANSTMYYNTLSSGSWLGIVDQSGVISLTRNDLSSNGYMNLNGNSAAMTIANTSVESSGRVTIDGAVGTYRMYSNTIGNRAELDVNTPNGTHLMYYTTIENYRARLVLNATTYAYIYSFNASSNGQAIYNGGRADIRNSEVSSGALYTVTNGGTTARLWNSTLHSLSRVNSTNAYIYASQVGSQATLNALAFQFLRSRVHGLGTTTLTANNSNRYQENGTAGLV